MPEVLVQPYRTMLHCTQPFVLIKYASILCSMYGVGRVAGCPDDETSERYGSFGT